MNSKKKILKNLIYNIAATAIPIVALQLLLLPLISKHIDDDSYGLAVTIIALMNICPGVLGVALNNIRLIDYKEGGQNSGNFQRILLELCIINVFIVTLVSIYYEKTIDTGTILTVFLSLLWVIREYYIVQFQEKLQYSNILVNNILMTIGYLAGYGLFVLIGNWQLVYIVGYLIGMLHIIIKGDIWKETPVKTREIGHFRKETYWLSLSAILIRVTTYADRLLLYPILGGRLVSVYYAATVIAKLVSMAINPISSVLLAYMSKMQKRPKKALNIVLLLTAVVCIVGYAFILLVSRMVLSILYAEYLEEALPLVPYTTLAMVIYVMISVLNPLILKFFDMKWQLILNGSNAIVYVMFSLIGLKMYGIVGFCIGIVIVNAIKLATMLLLYYKGNLKSGIIDE